MVCVLAEWCLLWVDLGTWWSHPSGTVLHAMQLWYGGRDVVCPKAPPLSNKVIWQQVYITGAINMLFMNSLFVAINMFMATYMNMINGLSTIGIHPPSTECCDNTLGAVSISDIVCMVTGRMIRTISTLSWWKCAPRRWAKGSTLWSKHGGGGGMAILTCYWPCDVNFLTCICQASD